MAKRSRLDITFDMLQYLASQQNGCKPTHLMYKANLVHRQMKSYLAEMEGKKLIVQEDQKGRQNISITQKGVDYMQKVLEVRQFEEALRL